MLKELKPFLTLFILLLFFTNTFAAKFVAVAPDLWSKTSTWDKGSVPTSLDTVYIDGYSVTVDAPFSVKAIFMTNAIGTAATALNIRDSLTVLGDFNATSENNPNIDIDITAFTNGVLTVNGNMNLSRAANNTNDKKLLFQLSGDSKAFILGDLNYEYKNANINETSYEIYTTNSAILDVTGQTNLITNNGNKLEIYMQGTSQVILRDSLSMLAYGGQEIMITSSVNSSLQLHASAYLLNTNASVGTKVKADIGGNVAITGSVYMESTTNNMPVIIESEGNSSIFNVEGNIVMNATSEASNIILLDNQGTLKLGGNILRPTNFGALKMEMGGKLIFNGTGTQSMPEAKLAGSGNDSLYFGIIGIENTSSEPFTLNKNMTIKDSLVLTSGKIRTTDAALLIIEEGASIKGGNSSAYIEGPILKKGATAGKPFTFPIGDGNNYAPMTLAKELLIWIV